MLKFILPLLGLLAFSYSGWSQQPSPTPDVPKANIFEVKTLPTGGLLFAVRLFASQSKPLNLFRPPPRSIPGQPKLEGANDPRPFSLDGSTLQDLYTQKIYPNLSNLPSNPYVGPMDVTATVAPGGWYQLGLAFPPIPAPPEKNGKKQPYELLFSIPELKIETRLTLDPETMAPLSGQALR